MTGVIENIIFSFVDLVRATIIIGIPVLVIAFVGKKIHHGFSKNRSWIQSAMISTYIVIFLLIILAYFLPFLFGELQTPKFLIPDTLSPTILDVCVAYLLGIIRCSVIAGIFSILVLPLEFTGTAIHDHLKKQNSNKNLTFGLAVGATVFVSLILIFFVLPAIGINLIAGGLYLLYFA